MEMLHRLFLVHATSLDQRSGQIAAVAAFQCKQPDFLECSGTVNVSIRQLSVQLFCQFLTFPFTGLISSRESRSEAMSFSSVLVPQPLRHTPQDVGLRCNP